jgi:predicted ATPase
MVQQLDALHAINQQYGLASVIPGRENILRGWLLASHGQVETGLRMMQVGVELNAARHNVLNAAFYSALLAKAFALAARIQEGLATLERAMLQVEQTGERFYQAELFRLAGELKCSGNSDANAAQGCFLSALKVARSQQAKSLELRATTSLARLLKKQGKREEARAMLSDIYNWFTEGFDTADLKDAKALLFELSN